MPLNELPVFSPSYTKAYDFCPVRASLERHEGLSPSIADRGLIARISGTAFHAGAAVIHREIRARRGDSENPYPWPTCLPSGVAIRKTILQAADKAAETTYRTLFDAYVQAGGAISDTEYQKALALLRTALPKYAAGTPIRALSQITAIEKQYPQNGNAVIDVGGYTNEGVPTVIDIKYTAALESYAFSKRLESYTFDWKLSHYQWSEFPDSDTKATILLVVASPIFKILPHSWYISTAHQNTWLATAKQKWARMAASKGLSLTALEKATTHANMYGPCPFQGWCLEMNMEGTLPSDLIRVQWPRLMEIE